MRFARLLSACFAAVTMLLIVSHFMNLPARSFGSWVTAPRITKDASFDVSGLPSEATDFTWTSMWGMNRPSTGRSHPILSEIEVVVQHESRSGLVVLRVTGDSESEVDGFIATIRRDFERTYQQQADLSTPPITHSHFHSSSDHSETSFYWRQKYLWLLGSCFIASTLITAFLAKTKTGKPQSEQAGTCDAEEAV